MIINGEAMVTPAVLEAMAGTKDARLHEVTTALVRHLHAFIREVKPTEQEWEYGVEFLGRIGQANSAVHNEGVLFSDAVGVSTLVCLLNNGANGSTETAAALLGPFWRDNSPAVPDGGSIVRGPTPGPKLFATCQVLSGGAPVADARVDVWHSSPEGVYENQDPNMADMNLRGQFRTDAEGRFRFTSVKPAGYPVPTDGPTGDLLRAQGRHPFRPAHLHFLIHKPGLKTLITQVFVDDDEHLESDVVFGVTLALVGGYKKGEGPAPDGSEGEWWSLDYTFHMEPGDSRLPVPPIQ
ncbi:dioxygenase [Roseomonas sp. KE2513]|uniref:dioxygenase family protein n=1 Tax=Roseomonas sp. KE2513 TaxID=2479202 RepID=UPI0018E0166E|nr:dioxygenase [Roseomonas sp. KE2513]